MARYAGAGKASVVIRCTGATVQVRVEDDGRGFDLETALASGRLGLLGMRERAEMLGGTCEIKTAHGAGTAIRVEAPLSGPAAIEEPATGEVGRQVAPVDAAQTTASVELARAKALSNALVEITEGMSRRENAPDLLAFVLERAAATVACDYAVVALQKHRRWIVSHAYGLPEGLIGQPLLAAALPLAAEIERTGKVVVVNYTGSDEPLAVAARESGVFSGAGIPLVAAGRFLGAVAFVHNAAPISFKPSEVEFLRHLSTVISLVLEIIQLRGEAPAHVAAAV
jgi:GAF domain-containing protein